MKTLFKTGFFHIIGTGILNKLLSMGLSIFLVRLMSKTDYGSWAYAFNIISFFIIFNGLGGPSAVIQICSERLSEGDAYAAHAVFRYAQRSGILIDILLGILIAFTGLFIFYSTRGPGDIVVLYCAYPLLSLLFELNMCRLRVLICNREYALLTNIQTVLNVVLSMGGVLLWGITGLIIGQQLSFLISWLISEARYDRKENIESRSGDLRINSRESNREIAEKDILHSKEKGVLGGFWSISLTSSINNGMGHALTLVGTLLVGVILNNDIDVANYKVATTIPFALLFVPGMLITYIYPYFARHRNNRKWTMRFYVLFTGANMIAMGCIAALVGIFAESITGLLFGEEYLDTAPILRVMMIGFFITASVRQPTGNLLVTQRKLAANTFVGFSSLVMNVVSTIVLLQHIGVMGAAWAYTLTMLYGAIVDVVFYLKAILPLSYTDKNYDRQ